jgi:hypothetical protein
MKSVQQPGLLLVVVAHETTNRPALGGDANRRINKGERVFSMSVASTTIPLIAPSPCPEVLHNYPAS